MAPLLFHQNNPMIQSKLLSQRQEKRGELTDTDSQPTGMDSQLLGGL